MSPDQPPTLTNEQADLLRDKYVLWERASREGPMDLRDYNRRAAKALKAALCDAAETIRGRNMEAEIAKIRTERDAACAALAEIAAMPYAGAPDIAMRRIARAALQGADNAAKS